ncbi:MAG: hypothetical protein KGZ96_13450 [Clostridia bacterium]|nr:hypothetical protein [Clostridia bacterium]
MKDRVVAGLISGLIAGVAMNVIDWIGYILKLYDERLLDWAAVVTYGRLPNNIAEIIFAQAGQIVFSGLLGILFAYIIPKLRSENYLLKGWIYGVVMNQSLYAFAIAFKLPDLTVHTFNATVSHLISASVYGLVLTYTFKRLIKDYITTI